MDILVKYTNETIELVHKQNELWNKASKWLNLEMFQAFNPAIYQTFLEGTGDGLNIKKYVVKQILLLGNEQWDILKKVDNDLGNMDLDFLTNAYDLNEEMILNLIPNAEKKREYFSENTQYVTNDNFTYEQLENCLDYLFDE